MLLEEEENRPANTKEVETGIESRPDLPHREILPEEEKAAGREGVWVSLTGTDVRHVTLVLKTETEEVGALGGGTAVEVAREVVEVVIIMDREMEMTEDDAVV